MRLAIRLIVFGLVSLRGTCRVAALLAGKFTDRFPCHVAVQMWVLRFGLYKLTQPLARRDDWIYIIDYTIDFGAKKCLVVLGITLEDFRKCNCHPGHSDMEMISIEVHKKTSARIVLDALGRATARTGIPAEIVSDHGSDIKKGIELFLETHPQVNYTYDVTHKTAVLLKRHLKPDDHWQQFVKKACDSKRASVHTELAFLAPPKPRDKARWQNLEAHLDWAEKVLKLAGRDPQRSHSDRKMPHIDQKKFEKTFGWVRDFRNQFVEWRSMLNLLQAAKTEVKKNGIRKESAGSFKKAIIDIELYTDRLRQMAGELEDYLKEESAIPALSKVKEKKAPWLGCSDIIESVIGKYKSFSARTPMKEVGKTVLTMPVFTSKVTSSEVTEAMREISVADLEQWLEENIGQSLFAARKRTFDDVKPKKPMKNFIEKPPKAVGF